jgi:hypothetical protein
MSVNVFVSEFAGVSVSGILRDVEETLWPPPQWHVDSASTSAVSRVSNLCHMRGVTLSNSELCKMQSIGASPATMSLANTRTGDYERTRTLPERLNLSKQKRERKVAPSFLFSGVSSPPGTWRSSRRLRFARATVSEGHGRYPRSHPCCPHHRSQSCTSSARWKRGLDRSCR